MATTPDAMRFDPEKRAIVLVPYEVLQQPRRAAMDRFAAIGMLGLSGQEQYRRYSIAYAGFQKMMVRQAIAERPTPRFCQLVAMAWPK